MKIKHNPFKIFRKKLLILTISTLFVLINAPSIRAVIPNPAVCTQSRLGCVANPAGIPGINCRGTKNADGQCIINDPEKDCDACPAPFQTPETNSAPQTTSTNTGIRIGDFFGFGNITSLGQGTNLLVAPIFSIAAAIVIIYFLLGAFKYLKSGGNKEEVEGARQMLTHSIIGFIILMFAFLILQFIPQFFNLQGLDITK